jgi:hypothetical protein
MEILYLAIDGRVGSDTRHKIGGEEFVISVMWMAEAEHAPFYDEDEPPPDLVLGEPGMWMCSLSQSDGTMILAGQTLRNGTNITSGYRGDTRFPEDGYGALLARDLSGNGADPGRDDLEPGSSVRLVYLSAAEIEAAAAEE